MGETSTAIFSDNPYITGTCYGGDGSRSTITISSAEFERDSHEWKQYRLRKRVEDRRWWLFFWLAFAAAIAAVAVAS